MSKKIEVQLAELTTAVAGLVTRLAPRAKATAQAPKAKEPKARRNPWDAKPGTTNSDAVSNLQLTGGTELTVVIEGKTLNAVVGESYTNKRGALRCALWVEGLGFTTVRAPDGTLPKAGKVRFSLPNGEASELVQVEFSA